MTSGDNLEKVLELHLQSQREDIAEIKAEIRDLKMTIIGNGKSGTRGMIRILENLETRIHACEMNEQKYVEKTAFEPIKMLAYGGVGGVLMIILGAIVALVIRTST